VLLVPVEHEAAALHELVQYEEENRAPRPKVELPPAAYGGGRSVLVYGALLALFFFLQHVTVLGSAWYQAGVADAAAIRHGEIWRGVTALFLHADLVHVLSNLLYGAVLGFLVAYVHGGGLGWLAILLAGWLGNLTTALLQDPDHRAVGASTAVFGAVGVLAGAEWLRRTLIRETRLRIVAPLVIGFLLLGYLGMGGAQLIPETLEVRPADRHTDISAHVTGMFWGLPIGALLTLVPLRYATDRRFQLRMAAVACGLIALAWILAITVGAQ